MVGTRYAGLMSVWGRSAVWWVLGMRDGQVVFWVCRVGVGEERGVVGTRYARRTYGVLGMQGQ